MMPNKPLPYSDDFGSPEEYIDELLKFAVTSEHFQLLSGGVHILDMFTSEPELFQNVFPEAWRDFLTQCDPMALLDLLMRNDLDVPPSGDVTSGVPDSLLEFIRAIRRLSLRRSFTPKCPKLAVLPRAVALGMRTKKLHEVTNFAGYVDRLVENIASTEGSGGEGRPISHLVDFGSGKNYLGRALASDPYNHRVVAVESREGNISGAMKIDVLAGVAEKATVKRNKKLWLQAMAGQIGGEKLHEKFKRKLEKLDSRGETMPDGTVDFRPSHELEITYVEAEGRGYIQYVQGRLENGDLSAVIPQIKGVYSNESDEVGSEPSLLGISIHSCGNLTHHAVRSLVINPAVRAVAIVGCCYNVATERLGPADYKLPYLRPSVQPLNARLVRESERQDPQGFPMSKQMCEYNGQGIRLNIIARMMACQAPENWSAKDSDDFFTRHFYRAVLQRIFLDRGVVSQFIHGQQPRTKQDEVPSSETQPESPPDTSTSPVILGSLSKPCYRSFRAYVRGAIKKLMTNEDFAQHAAVVHERMEDITDAEIDAYEARYGPRKVELSAAWSLMAFSAQVTEALMVADRWIFLREHSDVVGRCWVETVFDYTESPRNLVVVGIKR